MLAHGLRNQLAAIANGGLSHTRRIDEHDASRVEFNTESGHED
jgi:hypothetical protein